MRSLTDKEKLDVLKVGKQEGFVNGHRLADAIAKDAEKSNSSASMLTVAPSG